MTGANSGASLETAKQLTRQGVRVVGVCCRLNAEKKVFAKFDIVSSTIEIMELDLASVASIRQFDHCNIQLETIRMKLG